MTPPPDYEGPPGGTTSSSSADIALIVSISGLVGAFIMFCVFAPLSLLGLIAAVVGLVLGVKARSEARRVGNERDQQRATGAIVVGSIGLALLVLSILILLAAIAFFSSIY